MSTVLLTWSGLRGGISAALALSLLLDASLAQPDDCLALVLRLDERGGQCQVLVEGGLGLSRRRPAPSRATSRRTRWARSPGCPAFVV